MTETDFSLTGLGQLLNELQRSGYKFVTFAEASSEQDVSQPLILLRHDLDFSLDCALNVADLENSIGVTSTFFVHLRSSLYNPFSTSGIATISELHRMGHQVGLHLNTPSDDAAKDLAAFRSFIPFALDNIVSIHRPGMTLERLQSLELSEGVMHTYLESFTKGFHYISDSGCRWRGSSPLESDAYATKQNLQLLLHPFWWTEEGRNGQTKLRTFAARSESLTLARLERDVISFPF
jgi:hypothetical protein